MAIHDAEGNPVTTATELVTIALTGGPEGSALSGTLEVAPVDGIATLRGLSIDQPGTGYMLAASAAGFTAATTHPFNVYGVGAERREAERKWHLPEDLGLFEVFASVETASGGFGRRPGDLDPPHRSLAQPDHRRQQSWAKDFGSTTLDRLQSK